MEMANGELLIRIALPNLHFLIGGPPLRFDLEVVGELVRDLLIVQNPHHPRGRAPRV